MTAGSLCALGGLTPLPVMSALKYFPEDFGLTPRDVAFIGDDLTISTSGAASTHAIAGRQRPYIRGNAASQAEISEF